MFKDRRELLSVVIFGSVGIALLSAIAYYVDVDKYGPDVFKVLLGATLVLGSQRAIAIMREQHSLAYRGLYVAELVLSVFLIADFAFFVWPMHGLNPAAWALVGIWIITSLALFVVQSRERSGTQMQDETSLSSHQ